MIIAAMDATMGSLILGIVSVIFTFLGIVVTGLVSVMLARIAKEQVVLKTGQTEIKEELKEVHKTANGLSEKLMEASQREGQARGEIIEHNRAKTEQAAVDRGAAEERLRAEINSSPTGSTVATVNGTIAENVQIVKDDVQIVKKDVQDVKSEVIKDVKAGITKAVEEARSTTIEQAPPAG